MSKNFISLPLQRYMYNSGTGTRKKTAFCCRWNTNSGLLMHLFYPVKFFLAKAMTYSSLKKWNKANKSIGYGLHHTSHVLHLSIYCHIERRKIKSEVVYLGVPGAVTVSSLVLCPQFSFSMSRLCVKEKNQIGYYIKARIWTLQLLE